MSAPYRIIVGVNDLAPLDARRPARGAPAGGPGPPGGAGGPGRSGRSVTSALRYAAPALLAYAAVRLLGVVVLELWSQAPRKTAHILLSGRWDSVWYTRVAEDGYGYTVVTQDGGLHSDLAFFPLLPGLERALDRLSPLGAAEAGLLVASVASLLAAWGLFAIGDRLHGRRAGVLLAVLWAVLPVGIVQSMAYTESLFTAFAAWALYAVLTGRWVWAGAFAALAGLTRPTGAAVVAAVVLAAAAAAVPVVRASGLREAVRAHPRMLLGVLLAPLGWLGYVAWVGVREGAPLAYLEIQGRWGNGFDGGHAFAAFVWERLAGGSPASLAAGLGLCAGVALVVWLYVLCVRQRQPLVLLVYCGAVVALALCASGYFGSKPRMLLPAFPLLLPVAVALARVRDAAVALVLAGAALGSAGYGAFWLHGSGPP